MEWQVNTRVRRGSSSGLNPRYRDRGMTLQTSGAGWGSRLNVVIAINLVSQVFPGNKSRDSFPGRQERGGCSIDVELLSQ